MEESKENRIKKLWNKLIQHVYWTDVFCKFIGEPKITSDGNWSYEIEIKTIKYYFMGIRIWTKVIKDEQSK